METNSPNNRSPLQKYTKRSSFITDLENEKNMRIANLQKSRRQHSHSTIMNLHQIKVPFTPTSAQLHLKDKDLSPRHQELGRVRSLKTNTAQKPIIQSAEKTTNDLNENMVRLKVQQMTFKYKTKISCLLKELNISTNDMIHFNNINKTEEILNFLSLKVREKLTKTQISEENYLKNKSKSKEEVKEHEVEIQILRKKMVEKQSIEKELKTRLRESQAQARDLLNTINQKEKELSLRMDQLYQQKMTLAQQQKLIKRLQSTCQELQILNKNSLKQLNTESNDILNMNKQLEERNVQLVSMMDQLKEQIKQYKEKQNKLLEINRQLSEEVIRWRQRYEDGFLTQHQKERTESNGEVNAPISPSALSTKKSIMSMNNLGFAQSQMGNSRRFQSFSLQIQNTRLKSRAQQLKNRNKQLIRGNPTINERYSQTLEAIDQQNYDLSKGLDEPKMQKIKSKSVDTYRAELQTHYQKKIEEMAKSWKEKLCELVHEYEDQLQKVNQQMNNLQSQRDEMQIKILNLAKQKYLVQTRLIEKEREIYDMTHILSINSIAFESKKGRQENHSNSIIISENEIKPIELLQAKEQSKQNPQPRKQDNQEEDKIKLQTKQGDSL